jgi:hypothetical protein
VAFANEDFASIHWFKRLETPGDDPNPNDKNALLNPPKPKDTGLLFYAYVIPENVSKLEYRMVINGLWTVDPMNPDREYDNATGLARSVFQLPAMSRSPESTATGKSKTPVRFAIKENREENGEITVAGDFNNWDPYMYPLEANGKGWYTLDLPLKPGSYHYVFYKNGERMLDPANPSRVYYADGQTASSITVYKQSE